MNIRHWCVWYSIRDAPWPKAKLKCLVLNHSNFTKFEFFLFQNFWKFLKILDFWKIYIIFRIKFNRFKYVFETCQNDIWFMIHDFTRGKSLPRSLLKVEYWDRYHCDGKFIVDTGVSATPWFILTLITSHFFFDRPVLIVITVSRLKIVASLIAQITVQCPL